MTQFFIRLFDYLIITKCDSFSVHTAEQRVPTMTLITINFFWCSLYDIKLLKHLKTHSLNSLFNFKLPILWIGYSLVFFSSVLLENLREVCWAECIHSCTECRPPHSLTFYDLDLGLLGSNLFLDYDAHHHHHSEMGDENK